MSLSTYLKQHNFSYDDFGALVGVTGTTIYRYTKGDRRPTGKILQKIFDATNGQITANDFYISLPTKRNGRKP